MAARFVSPPLPRQEGRRGARTLSRALSHRPFLLLSHTGAGRVWLLLQRGSAVLLQQVRVCFRGISGARSVRGLAANARPLSPFFPLPPLRCRSNGMYYGGEPAAWTTAPAIPDGARFEHSAAAKAAARAEGGAGKKERWGEKERRWGLRERALVLFFLACSRPFYAAHPPRPLAPFSARRTRRMLTHLRTRHPQARPQPSLPAASKSGSQPWLTPWLAWVVFLFRSLGRRARPGASAKSAWAPSGPSPHLLAEVAGAGVRGRRRPSPCPRRSELLSSAGRRHGSGWPNGRRPTSGCKLGCGGAERRGEQRGARCGGRVLVVCAEMGWFVLNA